MALRCFGTGARTKTNGRPVRKSAPSFEKPQKSAAHALQCDLHGSSSSLRSGTKFTPRPVLELSTRRTILAPGSSRARASSTVSNETGRPPRGSVINAPEGWSNPKLDIKAAIRDRVPNVAALAHHAFELKVEPIVLGFGLYASEVAARARDFRPRFVYHEQITFHQQPPTSWRQIAAVLQAIVSCSFQTL